MKAISFAVLSADRFVLSNFRSLKSANAADAQNTSPIPIPNKVFISVESNVVCRIVKRQIDPRANTCCPKVAPTRWQPKFGKNPVLLKFRCLDSVPCAPDRHAANSGRPADAAAIAHKASRSTHLPGGMRDQLEKDRRQKSANLLDQSPRKRAG